MKIRLFSKTSNPLKDIPFLHKSKTYVDSLISTGEAIMLNDSEAQLTGWLAMRQDESLDRSMARSAGSGFDSAWAINQSGPFGPMVWQMNS